MHGGTSLIKLYNIDLSGNGSIGGGKSFQIPSFVKTPLEPEPEDKQTYLKRAPDWFYRTISAPT
mgnify:FL=1|jgi:hypothetical protein